MTDSAVDEVYTYTDGHAYVMRVLVGEIAKEQKWIPLKSLVPRRRDLLTAVFERSFNRLTPEARWTFLCVASWRSLVSELALFVVLGLREFDSESAIEECIRLSLLSRHELADEAWCASAPELARVFARKKLHGDADRIAIQCDIELLREFGPLTPEHALSTKVAGLMRTFIDTCMKRVSCATPEVVERHDSMLLSIAELWPPGWRELARFRRHTSAEDASIEYALRRACEELPFEKDVWLARAAHASEHGDASTKIAAYVSAVEVDPTDVEFVKMVAFELCKYVDDHKFQIPVMRRGAYLASVRDHMERIAEKLDATGLSRLAWLFLLEDNQDGGWKYANMGLGKDSTNGHCLRIVERLDKDAYEQPG